MEVNNNVLDSISAASAQNVSSSTQSSQELENRFLTMLIAQIKNQDPLNPMENAEMTSQLAQLNMVGGIERLNGTIEGLAAGFRAQQALQAVNLVGRGVLVPGTTMNHSGEGSRFGFELDQAVDSITIRVLDSSGNAVERIDLGAQAAGVQGLFWDGLGADGQPLPHGRYSLEISATRDGKSAEVTPLSAQHVSAVTTGANGILIELLGSAPVSFDQVRQII